MASLLLHLFLLFVDFHMNSEIANKEFYLTQLFKIRFNCDLRIEEVKRLLDSSTPVVISIVQKPEVRYLHIRLLVYVNQIYLNKDSALSLLDVYSG